VDRALTYLIVQFYFVNFEFEYTFRVSMRWQYPVNVMYGVQYNKVVI